MSVIQIKDKTLDINDKIDIIVRYLKDKSSVSEEELLKLNLHYDYKYIDRIFEALRVELYDDIKSQDRYYSLMDRLVDAIVGIRYDKNKPFFLYPDVVSINNDVLSAFSDISFEYCCDEITALIGKIYDFTNETLSSKYIEEKLWDFYNLYTRRMRLDLESTKEFYNMVLNFHRNSFFSEERNAIYSSLKRKLRINPKKEKVIINSRKLAVISELIRNKRFRSLGVTEEEFRNIFNDVELSILGNKDVKKSGINLTKDILDEIFVKYMMEIGSVDVSDVYIYLMSNYRIDSIDVSKFIARKFEKVKLMFIDRISLDYDDLVIRDYELEKLSVNPSNFVIGDKDRYFRNMARILLSLSKEDATNIINNIDVLSEIKELILFGDLVEEFSIDTIRDILSKYSKIKARLLFNSDGSISNIKELIMLSSGYSSDDYISRISLGDNIVSKIGEENIDRYLEFYKKMFKRIYSYIPPIDIETDNFKVESSMHTDPNRLLVGHMYNLSCINLDNPSGSKTFEECLLKKTGDVIFIKDKDNNLISRILVFRRGNVIQLATQAFSDLPIELYDKVSSQILEKAKENGDNIDYVFVNAVSFSDNGVLKYKSISDKRFVFLFPHADLDFKVFLLGSKKDISEEGINLDFEVPPIGEYVKKRRDVCYDANDEEITRLRALDISFEQNVDERERKRKEFMPFCSSEYAAIAYGEDFYVAKKKDGTIERLILPSDDSRTNMQVAEAYRYVSSDTLPRIKKLENKIF